MREFVSRNLGDEVYYRLIDPFCSGVYAGDPSKLSMKAAFGRVRVRCLLLFLPDQPLLLRRVHQGLFKAVPEQSCPEQEGTFVRVRHFLVIMRAKELPKHPYDRAGCLRVDGPGWPAAKWPAAARPSLHCCHERVPLIPLSGGLGL